MSVLKRLRTRIARFAEALDAIDDPTGDYLVSLRKRVDKLERDVEHLEQQSHSCNVGSAVPAAR